jgi:hypothetical protein
VLLTLKKYHYVCPLVLISFWNNIINKFGFNESVIESIENYNRVNQYKQIKIINNTIYIDSSNTYSTFEDTDIIKNIHFNTEKEIKSKQELYLTLTVTELNVIKELNDVKNDSDIEKFLSNKENLYIFAKSNNLNANSSINDIKSLLQNIHLPDIKIQIVKLKK